MGKKSRAASGAVSGAASGALIGSAVPGIGTVVGAGVGGVLGGLGGYFGGDDGESVDSRIDDQLDQGNPYIDQGAYQHQWAGLLNQLRNNPQSIAEQQYRMAQQDQSAAVSAQARASGRPGAIRAAMAQQAQIGQGLGQGSSMARLQEQLANRQAYASTLGMVSAQELQRQQANQGAYINLLNARKGNQGPSDTQMAANAVQQSALAYAAMKRGA